MHFMFLQLTKIFMDLFFKNNFWLHKIWVWVLILAAPIHYRVSAVEQVM